jgi:type VI secretion system protein ImpE
MNALTLFQDGRLEDAISTQKDVVANEPDNALARLLLVDLLMYRGNLSEIRSILPNETAKKEGLQDIVEVYHEILTAEEARRKLAQGKMPHFPGEIPEHAQLRWQAIQHFQRGLISEALRAIDEAEAVSPGIFGQMDGHEFEGFRDSDDRFGSVLEFFGDGKYYWVPFESIRSIEILPMETPRDGLYVAVTLSLNDGTENPGFVPALYPLSHEHPDPVIQLGMDTDFDDESNGPLFGVGLRLFLVGEEELSLFEFQQLDIQPGE